MSCDNAIYHTAVDLDPRVCPELELGEYGTVRNAEFECHTADQSKSKGHRHKVQLRIIPDSTQVDPEYVWGDEGPIND